MSDKLEAIGRNLYEVKDQCKKLEYTMFGKAEKDSLMLLEKRFGGYVEEEVFRDLKRDVEA